MSNDIDEQIIRGDVKKLNISGILVESFEKSNKEILQIPKLNHHSIKERIFQSYIKGKLQKQ
ncbi:MAG: hypothetical protein ACXADU_20045 [Promethearchaeota archaeon]|jgi:hypothetical protein